MSCHYTYHQWRQQQQHSGVDIGDWPVGVHKMGCKTWEGGPMNRSEKGLCAKRSSLRFPWIPTKYIFNTDRRTDRRAQAATARVSPGIASPFSAYLNDTIVLYERSDIALGEQNACCRCYCCFIRTLTNFKHDGSIWLFKSLAKSFPSIL